MRLDMLRLNTSSTNFLQKQQKFVFLVQPFFLSFLPVGIMRLDAFCLNRKKRKNRQKDFDTTYRVDMLCLNIHIHIYIHIHIHINTYTYIHIDTYIYPVGIMQLDALCLNRKKRKNRQKDCDTTYRVDMHYAA